MKDIDSSKDRARAFAAVCKLFDKSENDVNQDIAIIKKWLDTQNHLPEIMGNSHIRNFLILGKFSIQKTKRHIEMYYTIRSLIPDFFDDCNPSSPRMKNIYSHAFAGVLPNLTQDLCRVHIGKLKEPNSLFFPQKTVAAICNYIEIRLHEDCFYYDIWILDLSNISFSEVTKITPKLVKNILTVFQNAFPLRAKAAYLINAPSYVSKCLAVVKTLIKPKLFERIHVYRDDGILKTLLSVDTLPKDYGGYGPSLHELTDTLLRKFDQYQNRFDQLDKMRIDENLRPEQLIDDDIFGFYGNFKTLNID